MVSEGVSAKGEEWDSVSVGRGVVSGERVISSGGVGKTDSG